MKFRNLSRVGMKQLISMAAFFIGLSCWSAGYAETISVFCYIYDPAKPDEIALEKPLYRQPHQQMNIVAQWDPGFYEYIISSKTYRLLIQACRDDFPGQKVHTLTGKKVIEKKNGTLTQRFQKLSKVSQFIGTTHSGVKPSENLIYKAVDVLRSFQMPEALAYILNSGSVQQVIPGVTELSSGKYKEEMHILTKLHGIYRHKFSNKTDLIVSPASGAVQDSLETYLLDFEKVDWKRQIEFISFFLDKIDHLSHINPNLDFLSPQTILDFNRMKVRMIDLTGSSVYQSEETEADTLENMSIFALRPVLELFRQFKPKEDKPKNLDKRIRLLKLISWILHTRTQGFDSPWQLHARDVIGAGEPRVLTSMANIGNTYHYFYFNRDQIRSPILEIKSVMSLGFKVPQLVVSEQHLIGYFTQNRTLKIDMNKGIILENKYEIEKVSRPWIEEPIDRSPWLTESFEFDD